jgi:hypothetical protein
MKGNLVKHIYSDAHREKIREVSHTSLLSFACTVRLPIYSPYAAPKKNLRGVRNCLKGGQCHETFDFRFSRENSRRYWKIKMRHGCQRHRDTKAVN